MKDKLLDLLGSIVIFEYKSNINHDVELIRGLVIGVSIELNGKHSISIRDYNDSEDCYLISKIENLKVFKIEPEKFFENFKKNSSAWVMTESMLSNGGL